MAQFSLVACASLILLPHAYALSHPNHYQHDVVIYGGTSGGIASAIQLSRLNRTVALIEPSDHFGGIAVDGFGASDVDSQVRSLNLQGRMPPTILNHRQPEFQNSPGIGSLGIEFYRRISTRYGNADAFDTALKAHTKNKTLWRFESHVAESVVMEWLGEENIELFPSTQLKQSGVPVIKQVGSLKGISCL